MKKRLVCVICVFMLALSCGCYSEKGDTHSYIIASIGFDRIGGYIKATAEAVAVNSEDDAGKKRIVLTGFGATAEKAVKEAQKKATAPFNLSHCGMILLGKTLKDGDFSDICEYCYNTDEITFSVYMAVTDNSSQIMSKEPMASVAVGYDLMSKIEKTVEKEDIKLRNSLYEVVADKNRKNSKILLPFFSLSGEYSVISGLAEYKDGKYSGLSEVNTN